MGVFRSYYLGPYLEVESKKGIKTKTDLMCLHAECERQKPLKTPFCPQCGCKGTTVSREVSEELDGGNYLAAIESKSLDFYDLWYVPHAGGYEVPGPQAIIPNKMEMGFNLLNEEEIGDYFRMDLPTTEEQEMAMAEFVKYSQVTRVLLHEGGFNVKLNYGLIFHTS